MAPIRVCVLLALNFWVPWTGWQKTNFKRDPRFDFPDGRRKSDLGSTSDALSRLSCVRCTLLQRFCSYCHGHFLFGSWSAFHRAKITAPLPRFLVYAALMVAFVSTALNVIWNACWLNHGGSPHGMGAGPGLWQNLGPFLLWSFAAATVLSFFGRGKARVLMLSWSVSMWLVFRSSHLVAGAFLCILGKKSLLRSQPYGRAKLAPPRNDGRKDLAKRSSTALARTRWLELDIHFSSFLHLS
jgi:hypothetical protein